jgi:hypothetical protein
MSESNDVKFVEADGKWLWKRYDINGSVIFRSPEFNTEREAREDYNVNGGTPTNSLEADKTRDTAPEAGPVGGVITAPTESNDAGNVAPQESNDAGSASLDANQGANTI